MAYDYLITTRRLAGSVFEAEPGPVRYIKVPDNVASYDASHVISPAQWTAEVQGLADGDENPNSISPTGDVLVFVHGYNNDISSVLMRMRQLRGDLRAEAWHGAVISFDWPSNNQLLNYLEDRADAARVAIQLVDSCITRLAKTQKAGCKTNVHLIGHSTGAYVIMEAIAQAQSRGPLYKSDWRVGQVAFIAADVSSASLALSSLWSGPMFSRIMRLTNYANGFDSVLAVSNAKRLGVEPRVGRVGLPADANPKAVNVDCSDYFKTLDPNQAPRFGAWTHSWHFGNRLFALDLALTLEGAIDRDSIPTRRQGSRGLVLQPGSRPNFQNDWGIAAAAKDSQKRA
jgi:esterase/lipase superfamily enzyme